MSTSTGNDNLIDDVDENFNEGTEAALVRPAIAGRTKRRWRSIEQYWEERRLRERLKDYLVDDE